MGDGRAGLGALPTVLTGAFRLRALEIDDWVVEQQLSRDPEVVRWTYYPADLDEARARLRIAGLLERTAAGLVQRYVILDEAGLRLGTCGIGKLPTDRPEVFYAVIPSARGRGAATEAARLLAGLAFDHGYPSVALETIEGNVASERVAERAGFVPGDRFDDDHRGQQVRVTRWVRHASAATA